MPTSPTVPPEHSATPPPPHLDDTELFCPECDYNLTGAPGHRCPWCGWIIDLEVLYVQATTRPGMARVATVAGGVVVGLGSLAVMTALVLSRGRPSPMESVALGGVAAAALGHLAVAGLAWMSRRRWPIPRPGAAGRLALVGLMGMTAGLVGAWTVARTAPAAFTERGVNVTGLLEFVLSALLFATPGALLVLSSRACFHIRPGAGAARYPGRRRGAEEPSFGPPFLVDVAAVFRAGAVTQRSTPSPRPTTARIEAAIERTWQAEVALAETQGRRLFNGALGRLESFEVVDGKLELVLGATCYRDFIGTNAASDTLVRDAGEEFLANPLGISTIVVSSDRRIALGRRGRTVALHPGYLHTFGGMLESPDRLAEGGYDVFGSAMRELCEELPLSREQIRDLYVVGLVRDRRLLQPELLFVAQVGLSSFELETRFGEALRSGGTPDVHEHLRLEWCEDEPAGVLGMVEKARPVAPVAEAGLLLYGLSRWGRAWYEGACVRVYGSLAG